MGYPDSILVLENDKLIWDIVRFTGIKTDIATHVVNDLTYGSRGIKHPDPALQPLIKANKSQYLLSPTLLTASSMERNLIMLLNRSSTSRTNYLQLVQEKEQVMSTKIKKGVKIHGIRYSSGKIRKDLRLPDIDLSIISDEEKMGLIFELKWLVAPAEPREIIEKSGELRKGVLQLLRLQDTLQSDPDLILEALGIDSSYDIFFCVVSENFIGTGMEDDPDVPIIERQHLVDKINECKSLREVVQWLRARSFLPIEGVHFNAKDEVITIGKWSIKWYLIEALTDKGYT